MAGELTSRMRSRVEQLRRVVFLAHDPRVIEAVQRVINEIEEDIKRLEAREQITRISKVET